MPLKLFEYIEDDSLKDKIEFIDYPGLDTDFQLPSNFNLLNNQNQNEKENTSKVNLDNNTKALLEYTNGFLFVNDGIQVLEHGNKVLLERILDNIRKRQSNFSFKSCIFILNKCDTAEIDIEKSRNDFIKLINNIQTTSNDGAFIKRLYNPNELRNENDMNVTKFSSKLFNGYLNTFKDLFNKYFTLFDSNNNINETIDLLTKEFKKIYGKNKIKIEYKDIQINNFRLSFEYLKECKIPNVNFAKYQSNIEEISKLYLYIKEISKVFNLYVSSNSKNFFESLLKVITESNKFYINELQISEIHYFIKLNQKLSDILESISEKSSEINPDFFTEENEKKIINEIKEKTKNILQMINDKIYGSKLLINSNIRSMHQHINKYRTKFNKVATDIADNNYKILEDNKYIINEIVEKFKIMLEKYIEDIKKQSKNDKYENLNILSLDEIKPSLSTYIYQENNFAYDVLIESDMNIIFKMAAAPFAIVGGIIGSLLDHSEEHKNIIKDYEKSVNDSLSIYEEKIEKNVKEIENYYCEQVKDIFSINGEDLKKIKNNENLFKEVDKEFENFLSSLVEK